MRIVSEHLSNKKLPVLRSHGLPCVAMHGPPMEHLRVKFGSKKNLMAHRWGRKIDMSEKIELRWKLG